MNKSKRPMDSYWPSARICIRNGYKIKDAGVWCDYIEGIPLTPSFLEKNGFNIKDSEDSKISYIKDIDSSPLEIPRRYLYIERRSLGWGLFIGIKGFSDSVMIRQIQYIHELQHILWAMGIDASFEI